MRQRLALGLLIFVLVGLAAIKIDYLIEGDPLEPKWRLDGLRDYKAEEVQVNGRHVIVTHGTHIHEYDADVQTWDKTNYRVVKIANDNHRSHKTHGLFKWKVYVPSEK